MFIAKVAKIKIIDKLDMTYREVKEWEEWTSNWTIDANIKMTIGENVEDISNKLKLKVQHVFKTCPYSNINIENYNFDILYQKVDQDGSFYPIGSGSDISRDVALVD